MFYLIWSEGQEVNRDSCGKGTVIHQGNATYALVFRIAARQIQQHIDNGIVVCRRSHTSHHLYMGNHHRGNLQVEERIHRTP